ncbi:DUF3080 family protein [Halioglobus sp. HI00S01]|uniref:DUF3080 family protein n=1 Tax=Halioglobus sp. HI00S01 TaxID=1822214 RepID=UPI001E365EFB|nr:DUF3080 family protein [Halioglobus sp. HI00S01]
MRYKSAMRFWFFTLLLLLVTACDRPDQHTPYAQYLARLQNTLDQRISPPTPTTGVPRRPRPGQLRLAVPADDLDVLDFMELRGCALQETIGKRNSILGRHARDSQRLLLELEFLRLAPPCVDKLMSNGQQALAEQLQRNVTIKREQLPARIFNATLANDEFGSFWRVSEVNPSYPENTSSVPVTSLASINALARQWLAGDYRVDNREFELLLYDLSTGDGASLWLALDQQAAWLEGADQVLRQRAANGPLCQGRIRPAAADVLPTVVRKFFIQGIQPRAAMLGRRYHDLMPPLQALEAQLQAVLPTDYRHWQQARDRDLRAYSEAPARHVQNLQNLLKPCGGINGN